MEQLKRLGIVMLILLFLLFAPYYFTNFLTNNATISNNYFLNYLGLSVFGCLAMFAFIVIIAVLIGVISCIINYIETGKL